MDLKNTSTILKIDLKLVYFQGAETTQKENRLKKKTDDISLSSDFNKDDVS